MGGEACISLNPEPFCTRRKEKEIPVCRRGAALGFMEFPEPALGWGWVLLKACHGRSALEEGQEQWCMVMKDECGHQLGTWGLWGDICLLDAPSVLGPVLSTST